MRRTHNTDRSRARGFTLIELLVVIGIIGLLIGITLVVGNQVMTGGKKSLTQDTLRVLDMSLAAYVNATGGNPPPFAAVDPLQPTVLYLAADAKDMTNSAMINGLVVFMSQASSVPEAKGILEKLPSKTLRVFNDDASIVGQPVKKVMVVDGWGQPIRYVHPAFQGNIYDDVAASSPNAGSARRTDQVLGTQTAPLTYATGLIRRNHTVNALSPTADSDGGTCPGTRPYFYSAGPDGLVGLNVTGSVVNVDYNKDNVYTTRPNPAKP